MELTLSRRDAIGSLTGLVVGVTLPLGAGPALARTAAAPKPVDPNVFIHIGTDDIVTVLSKHLEMGQGPFTGLATLVAEELDADWAQIRSAHSPADDARYANLFMGVQLTGGSTAIGNSFDQMRHAGAAARAMLVLAAAQAWKVRPDEITVDKGVIRHAASKREARFGQFTEAAARLPVPPQVKLKDAAAFRLIGKERGVGRPDSAAKSTGRAKFTIDIAEPEMLTVVVARPDRFGGKLASFDASEALKVKGVVAVKAVPSGVAVYARGMWPAIKARKALVLRWDDAAAELRGSEQIIDDYRKLAATPGEVATKIGDAPAALAAAGTVIEREYVFPYLAHAPMEPLDGYIRWNAAGAEARYGCQYPSADRDVIAAALGISPEKVNIEVMIAGGSFGRRAQPAANFAKELGEVARAIGPDRPIKLVWTREDDIRGGFYRPIVVHRMRGAVAGGKITAWANTVVSQSFFKGTPIGKMLGGGIEPTLVEGARNTPYDIPAFLCDAHDAPSPVSCLWWRSVGHTHTGYAVECFVDELLVAAGVDPVEGRLAMMAKAPRAAGVLRAVAALADWKGAVPAAGRARGVAVVEAFGSFVAQVAEVSIGEGGEPKVRKIWCAVDLGIAVNPDVIRAQVEGGIGYALGHALYAEVPLVDGRPAVSNFNDYRSLRIHEMPEVEVTIVASTEKPSGIGEPGVPPLAPAVANALARLGRARPARLPMVRPV